MSWWKLSAWKSVQLCLLMLFLAMVTWPGDPAGEFFGLFKPGDVLCGTDGVFCTSEDMYQAMERAGVHVIFALSSLLCVMGAIPFVLKRGRYFGQTTLFLFAVLGFAGCVFAWVMMLAA